jgi:hypothetical protein
VASAAARVETRATVCKSCFMVRSFGDRLKKERKKDDGDGQ